MSQFLTGQASKALVAVLTTISAALPLYFASAKWVPIVVMGIGAATVYLVPNATPPGQAQGKDQPPSPGGM